MASPEISTGGNFHRQQNRKPPLKIFGPRPSPLIVEKNTNIKDLPYYSFENSWNLGKGTLEEFMSNEYDLSGRSYQQCYVPYPDSDKVSKPNIAKDVRPHLAKKAKTSDKEVEQKISNKRWNEVNTTDFVSFPSASSKNLQDTETRIDLPGSQSISVDEQVSDTSDVFEHPSTSVTVSASKDYDVVIRYERGDISIDDFISHLRAALCRRGISVYEELNQVDTDTECRILIILLTSTYVPTNLLSILEHQQTKYRVVYPIFYRLSPFDLIRNKKDYERFFIQEEPKRWQAALEELAQRPGYTLTDKSESEVIDEIVRDALMVLCSSDKVNMIGMDTQIEEILSLLCIESLDVRCVGIWGTVGIGKTTIAEEIFRRISVQYETCVFLKDLHKEVEAKGHDAVREDFLCKLLEVEPDVVRFSDIKTSFLRGRLQCKRVLVILDDVNDYRDVETFLGKLNYFGPGSKIIITSRNRRVFVLCKLSHVYEVKPLDISKSLALLECRTPSVFSLSPTRTLSLELVKFSNGNPQVLQFLSTIDREWKPLSRKIQKISPIYIPSIFERSCVGLDDNERSIFLDIACFFNRVDKDNVAMLLDGCGFSTHVVFRSLVDKSLLKISQDNMVDMLSFIQATGREIVRQESADRPGDRSRLWNDEDIRDVFLKDTGTSAVEGIFLDMSEMKFDANPNVFEKMCNLRLLKFYFSKVEEKHGVSFPQGLEYLPSKLRLLHWEYYPLISLPRSFDPKNLVEINLPSSCAKKLWKGKKSLEKLRNMRLSYSYQLTKIPRLSSASNLEHIDLEGCTSLLRISQSISYLKKLVFLNLKDCSKLKSVPSMVDLESLEVLNLSGCSNLENFPEISPNVKELYMGGTRIQEIPSSVKDLVLLEKLDLEDSRHLKILSTSICKLKHLDTLNLSDCISLERFPDLSRVMKCLRFLDLRRTAIKELPSSISYLTALEKLRFEPEPPLSMKRTDIDLQGSFNTKEGDSSKTISYTLPIYASGGSIITSWQKGQLLGRGSFGSVYEGISGDGDFFAVKEVSLHDLGSQAQKWIQQLEGEISLLSQLQHQNIVRYRGTAKDGLNLYIFLKLVTQGSLRNLYQRYKLTDSVVSVYTRQILDGLKFLHDGGFIHRELKCANILLDVNGVLKLTDYGLVSKLIGSSKKTPFWMAPEVITQASRNDGASPADIWSLGCTVLEMLTRQIPYSELQPVAALFKIGTGTLPEIPDTLSLDARHFILKCLKVNPEERPTAAELLHHPFVRRPLPSSGSDSAAEEMITGIPNPNAKAASNPRSGETIKQPKEEKMPLEEGSPRHISSVSISDEVKAASKTIQISMARLEDELRNILLSQTSTFEPDSLLLNSSLAFSSVASSSLTELENDNSVIACDGGKEEQQLDLFMPDGPSSDSGSRSRRGSRKSTSSIREIDLVSPEAVSDLRSIAQRMIGAGYSRECVQVYANVRKSVIEMIFKQLEIVKLEIRDVQKLDWVAVCVKISGWIRAAKVCVRVVLASEKRLCKQIFDSSMEETCFMEIVKDSALQLFSFPEAISISGRSFEKLFKILDLHDALTDLLPDMEEIFDSNSSKAILVQGTEIQSRSAEAARGILTEFQNAVFRAPSEVPGPGGTIHPMTRYVINYLKSVSDYKQTLADLIMSKPCPGLKFTNDPNKPDMDLSQLEGMSPLSMHMVWTMVMLQFNLEEMSLQYKDEPLSHIFVLNNVYYIVQKVKSSPELRELIGDKYLTRLTGIFRDAASKYQRAAWDRVLNSLRDDGLHVSGSLSSGVSNSVLRERFEAFNTMFEEVHRIQSTWLVPDTQLREEFRKSLSEHLIPAYRSFLGRFRGHIESGSHPENYLKYSVENLETAVLDFFEGYPVAPHLRRSQ